MAAFIPSRRDPEVNEVALARVRDDKLRESGDGFDGTWVAHPDLVPVATEVFDGVLGSRPNQVDRLREDVEPDAAALVDFDVPGRRDHRRRGCGRTSRSARATSTPGCTGTGAAAIDNLMEDVATAEIARSQVWSWVKAGRFGADDVRRELDRDRRRATRRRQLFAEVALARRAARVPDAQRVPAPARTRPLPSNASNIAAIRSKTAAATASSAGENSASASSQRPSKIARRSAMSLRPSSVSEQVTIAAVGAASGCA